MGGAYNALQISQDYLYNALILRLRSNTVKKTTQAETSERPKEYANNRDAKGN